jgi:GAF domain-containing protein
MAKANRPILLIARDDWLIGTIDSLLRSPSLFQGVTPEVVLRQASTPDEALHKFAGTEFFLILLEYGSPETAVIEHTQSHFPRSPIILIVRLEQEQEALAAIQAGKAQDYLLEEELTESVMRRLLRPAHLYVETRQRLREMQVLNIVADVANEATNVTDLLTEVTQIIADNLYPYHFGFILRDENGRWRPHPAYHSLHPLRLPAAPDETDSLIGWVARHGRARRIADRQNEPDLLPIDPLSAASLCAPLIIQGQAIGVMNAESPEPNGFSESDEQLLLTLGRQLATAIEKITLLEAERRQRQEAESLRDIVTTLASTLDHKQILDEILAQLDKVVRHDTACLFLLHGDSLTLQAARGYDHLGTLIGRRYPATDPFFREIQQTRQPIYLPDVQTHPNFQYWDESWHIRGWICAPLVAHDQVIGVLTVDNKEAWAYTPHDVALAQTFANQAAAALENARLYEAEQTGRETAEILRAATSALTQSLDQDTVLRTLIHYLVRLIPVDSASVLLLDKSGESASLFASWGFEQWTEAKDVEAIHINIHANQTLSPIFTKAEPVLIEDTMLDPRWEQFPPTAHVRSWLGVPILVGEKVIGAFSLDKATPHFFTEETLRQAQMMTAQAAVALQNAHLFAETERRAAELETITRISASLRLADSVEEILEIVLGQATAVVNANFSSIYLLETDSDALTIRLTQPLEPGLLGHRHKLGEGITGHVALSGEPHICQDARQSPYYVPIPFNAPLLDNLRATISLPLKTKNRVIGVMHFSVDQSHEFSRSEINLLTAISEIGASALERAMLLETLEQRVEQRTKQLLGAYEQLQVLDRLKTKFISEVSHELRTPVTNLSLYLDLLTRGKPEHRQQYEGILRKQTERLGKLIRDTLHISELDAGKVKMKLESLDLNELVTSCAAELQPLAEQSGRVRLTAVLQPNLPRISGDKKHLRTAIHNILKNAIDFTSEGSITLTTTDNNTTRHACLLVADTGLGINKEDLPHVFERFYRGTAVSQSTVPGTGLGLAIAKEIVNLHQGHISVTSHPGKGATFRICLPAAVNNDQ